MSTDTTPDPAGLPPETATPSLSTAPVREDAGPLPGPVAEALEDAPQAFTRAVEYCHATGGFDALRETGVWAGAFGDYALFLSNKTTDMQANYPPWGSFDLPARTLVVFRVGQLAGAADLEESAFHDAFACSESDLLVGALEAQLGLNHATFEWSTPDERAPGEDGTGTGRGP